MLLITNLNDIITAKILETGSPFLVFWTRYYPKEGMNMTYWRGAPEIFWAVCNWARDNDLADKVITDYSGDAKVGFVDSNVRLTFDQAGELVAAVIEAGEAADSDYEIWLYIYGTGESFQNLSEEYVRADPEGFAEAKPNYTNLSLSGERAKEAIEKFRTLADAVSLDAYVNSVKGDERSRHQKARDLMELWAAEYGIHLQEVDTEGDKLLVFDRAVLPQDDIEYIMTQLNSHLGERTPGFALGIKWPKRREKPCQ